MFARDADAAAVTAHLTTSRWRRHLVAGTGAAADAAAAASSGPSATEVAAPTIRVMAASAVRSTGHALRMLDATGAIRTETVLLIDAPVLVSNARLDTALSLHAARHKADSDAIITVVMVPTAGHEGSAPLHEQLVVTVNPSTSRLHAYVSAAGGRGARHSSHHCGQLARTAPSPASPPPQDLLPTTGTAFLTKVAPAVAKQRARAGTDPATAAVTSRTDLPVAPKVAKEAPDAAVRVDLMDTRVYICGMGVLVHFSDNYDYTVRQHRGWDELGRRVGTSRQVHLTPSLGAVPCDAPSLPQDIRRQYIHNEVLNVEMGFRFDYHVLTAGRVRPVVDWRSYAAATRDVCSGLLAPLTPQSNWAAPATMVTGASHLQGGWSSPTSGVWMQDGATVDATARLTSGAFAWAQRGIGGHPQRRRRFRRQPQRWHYRRPPPAPQCTRRHCRLCRGHHRALSSGCCHRGWARCAHRRPGSCRRLGATGRRGGRTSSIGECAADRPRTSDATVEPSSRHIGRAMPRRAIAAVAGDSGWATLRRHLATYIQPGPTHSHDAPASHSPAAPPSCHALAIIVVAAVAAAIRRSGPAVPAPPQTPRPSLDTRPRQCGP